MKDITFILFRDPVDFIIMLLALIAFIYWLIKKRKVNYTAAFALVAGYIFYVMYRFAVIYALMDIHIQEPSVRAIFNL